MNPSDDDGPFYIGYLPLAPPSLARFTRKTVAVVGGMLIGGALLSAVTLPYFGAGVFDFGRPQTFNGTLRCERALPRLTSATADYLLVGHGKGGVPLEICGASGTDVALRGTLIKREGRQLIEVATLPRAGTASTPSEVPIPLGRFTLTGEIVDSKCYFGVMNPAEGRMHRACAELCLRGGVPAVFIVRDMGGRRAHLLIADQAGKAANLRLLPWVGEAVELSGEVARQGKWFVLRPDWTSVRFATH